MNPRGLSLHGAFEPAGGRTRWERISREGVRTARGGGRTWLEVDPAALTLLSREAFARLAHFLRPAFLKSIAAILGDAGASDNDRFVAHAILRNAAIAAEGVLPLCQDTGTALILGAKGAGVRTDGRDEEALSRGVAEAYTGRALRASQMAPLTLFDEVNTGDNLPAQIDLAAGPGDDYRFLFMAKGGGSSNKTALFQETKALLDEARLTAFLREKVRALGVAACPPYRIAVVVGGTSPELCLKAVKLASAGALDGLPPRGNRRGDPFRDRGWERRVLDLARETGLGAQFGGKHLAHEVRFLRLPRHAGSCPVGIGVSCNADRHLRGRIAAGGLFLEALERNPARYLKRGLPERASAKVDLCESMNAIRRSLSAHSVGALLSLSGPLVVARDIAHARLRRRLAETGDLPDYLKRHPVYYAGPARTPEGHVTGSFGPTTARRMDSYLAEFMEAGASLVTLAKGDRTPAAAEACRAHGGFYLGTLGGAGALIAGECVTRSEVIDFADLGMEAVRRIEVRDLPAFLVIDARGRNLYDV
jgi:fumarate hydratase class I